MILCALAVTTRPECTGSGGGRSAHWIRARRAHLGTLPGGGVSERPKEHASKACKARAFEGSNPSATATLHRVVINGPWRLGSMSIFEMKTCQSVLIAVGDGN
jgi:hypothetical protein